MIKISHKDSGYASIKWIAFLSSRKELLENDFLLISFTISFKKYELHKSKFKNIEDL